MECVGVLDERAPVAYGLVTGNVGELFYGYALYEEKRAAVRTVLERSDPVVMSVDVPGIITDNVWHNLEIVVDWIVRRDSVLCNFYGL